MKVIYVIIPLILLSVITVYSDEIVTILGDLTPIDTGTEEPIDIKPIEEPIKEPSIEEPFVSDFAVAIESREKITTTKLPEKYDSVSVTSYSKSIPLSESVIKEQPKETSIGFNYVVNTIKDAERLEGSFINITHIIDFNRFVTDENRYLIPINENYSYKPYFYCVITNPKSEPYSLSGELIQKGLHNKTAMRYDVRYWLTDIYEWTDDLKPLTQPLGLRAGSVISCYDPVVPTYTALDYDGLMYYVNGTNSAWQYRYRFWNKSTGFEDVHYKWPKNTTQRVVSMESGYSTVSDMAVFCMADTNGNIEAAIVNTTTGAMINYTYLNDTTDAYPIHHDCDFINDTNIAYVTYHEYASSYIKFHRWNGTWSHLSMPFSTSCPSAINNEGFYLTSKQKNINGHNIIAVATKAKRTACQPISVTLWNDSKKAGFANFSTSYHKFNVSDSASYFDISFTNDGNSLVVTGYNRTTRGYYVRLADYKLKSKTITYSYLTNETKGSARYQRICTVPNYNNRLAIIHQTESNDIQIFITNSTGTIYNQTTAELSTEHTNQADAYYSMNNFGCYSERSGGEVLFWFTDADELKLDYLFYNGTSNRFYYANYSTRIKGLTLSSINSMANFASDDIQNVRFTPFPQGDGGMFTVVDALKDIWSGIYYNGTLIDASQAYKVGTTYNLTFIPASFVFNDYLPNISNLREVANGTNWIYLAWNVSKGYNHSKIYRDGVYKGKTSNKYYNHTYLNNSQLYNLTVVVYNDRETYSSQSTLYRSTKTVIPLIAIPYIEGQCFQECTVEGYNYRLNMKRGAIVNYYCISDNKSNVERGQYISDMCVGTTTAGCGVIYGSEWSSDIANISMCQETRFPGFLRVNCSNTKTKHEWDFYPTYITHNVTHKTSSYRWYWYTNYQTGTGKSLAANESQILPKVNRWTDSGSKNRVFGTTSNYTLTTNGNISQILSFKWSGTNSDFDYGAGGTTDSGGLALFRSSETSSGVYTKITFKCIDRNISKTGKDVYTAPLNSFLNNTNYCDWNESYATPQLINLSSFTKCKTVTINNPTSSTLTDFPLPLNITYDSDMQSDFDDIRIYSGDCFNSSTRLETELEQKNDGVNAYIWAKTTLVPGSNNISVYYGNSSSTHGWTQNGSVWSNGYIYVMHLSDLRESRLGTGSIKKDVQNSTMGAWGRGQLINKYGYIVSSASRIIYGMNDKNFTVEAWSYNLDDKASNEQIFSSSVHTRTSLWRLYNGFYNEVSFVSYNSSGEGKTADMAGSISTNGWVHQAGVYNGTHSKIFVNGTLQESVIEPSKPRTSTYDQTVLWIGGFDRNQDTFNGTIDEVRLSNVVRSHDWLNMSYRSIKDHSTLFTYGTEESLQSSSSNCSYTSGNWIITNEECNITSNVNIGLNDLRLVGSSIIRLVSSTVTLKRLNISSASRLNVSSISRLNYTVT